MNRIKNIAAALLIVVALAGIAVADIDRTIVQQALQGTVHIGCPQWQGSGFVIGPRLIATARHVVEGVEDFTVTTNDGREIKATRAWSMKNYDVGFIWIDGPDPELSPLSLGSIEDCQLGQSVFVVGSPYGKDNFNALSVGVVSGLQRDWGEDYGWTICFTTDAAGHPGNSGCPVFTMDGKVRGILVGGYSPVLISVMPCDLFLSDLQAGVIELMCRMDAYQREVEPTTPAWEYRIQELEDQLWQALDQLDRISLALDDITEDTWRVDDAAN